MFNTTTDHMYYLRDFWQEYGDQRTSSLPGIGDGPWIMATVMISYVLFVTRIGPKMMADRKPYELRLPMLIYNASMVAINAYFFFEALLWLDYGRQLFNFRWPDGKDTSVRTMANIWSFYLYWLTKFVDLLDTVFFVLRKKERQITPLHLYHHISVPVLGWIYIWYRVGAPAVYLFAQLNSLVHVVMYSYYALASFGPAVQKFLWWKKYLTQFQLIQFAMLCCYGVAVYSFQENYPPTAFWLATAQPPLFFVMFFDFYLQAYKNRLKNKPKSIILTTNNSGARVEKVKDN